MMEGEGKAVVQPPGLLRLTDARLNKAGEVEKRYGDARTSAATDTGNPQHLLVHRQALVQSGPVGSFVYDPLSDAWNAPNIAAPRPGRITTDPAARGNGSYGAAEIAYSEDHDLACMAFEDVSEARVRVVFWQASTGARLAERRVEGASMNRRPRVVFFNGVFVLFAMEASANNIYVATYSPAAADYAFAPGDPVVTTVATIRAFDVHVYDSASTACYLAVALGSNGWVCAQVSSSGDAGSSVTANTGRDLTAIAVHHNANESKVYILYPDTATSPDQLSLDVLADDMLSSPTKTKVLDYADVTTGLGRRCTLEVLDYSTGSLFCAVSHGSMNGGKLGGIDHISVSAAGAPNSDQGFEPNLILATKAFRDTFGRVVLGVGRQLFWDPSASGVGDDEPLPAAWLVTPCSYTTTEATDGQEQGGDPETVYGLAPLARFGHDRWSDDYAYEDYVGRVSMVGSVAWGPYNVEVAANPGGEGTTAPYSKILAHGYQFGLDLFRFEANPVPGKVAHVEGATLVPFGLLASFDGSRLVEANVPFVPPPIRWGGSFTIPALSTTDYTFASSYTTALGEYVVARMRYRYLFRWTDSEGNVHRSAISEPAEFTFDIPAEDSSTGGREVPGLSGGQPNFVVPLPSFTSLNGEGGVRLQVELYRDSPHYYHYDESTTPDTLVDDSDNRGDDFVLVGISEIAAVTGYPNLGGVRDPSGTPNTFPGAGARAPYDDGGELASEPPPAALDVVAASSRVFLIDAEDRLAVWYSKPLVDGLAPEFNATLKLRVSAEGGDLVALAALDDKLVCFKRGAIYVTHVLGGPDASGNGTQLLAPRRVSSDTGCVNVASIAEGPFGVAFEADRGIMLLDRGMNLRFIGDAVRDTLDDVGGDFGKLTIVDATVMPSEHEVRFSTREEVFLSDPPRYSRICLVWNYLRDAWSVTDNVSAVDAVEWRGLHTRLDGSSGRARYDTPGVYAAAAGLSRPLLDIETPWLQLDGIQGYQRVYNVLILGEHLSGDVRVEVAYNHTDSWVESHDFLEATISAVWPMQIKIKPQRQKCQAIKLRIREVIVSAPSTGKGFVLKGIRLDVGAKRGGYKHVGTTMRG